MDLVAPIESKIEWVDGDVLNVGSLEEAFEGVKRVYHCAGLVSYDPRDEDKMMQINSTGTANIINVALDADIDKLVHVSSIASIGRRPKLKIINEKTNWERSNWNSRYAISKYQGEMEVWRGSAEGLNVAIVNPSIIIGSGFWAQGTAQLFQRAWKGLTFFPKGATGYVDVRDVARFMIQLMESDVLDERYILNGANSTYLNFFTLVANALNKKPPSIPINIFLKEVAIIGEWLRSTLLRSKPLLTRKTVNHVERTFIYENDKSKAVFGFEYTPLEQTIEETAKQFLAAKDTGQKASILPLN